MERRRKYFVFNKESDFLKGCMENIEYESKTLRLAGKREAKSGSPSDYGLFFSRVLDSREQETRWHRLVVSSKSLGEASIRFRIYASELHTIKTDSGERDIVSIIKDLAIDSKEKQNLMKPYLIKTVLNPEDILLHEAKGRYLWFTIELFGQGDESPELYHLKIYLAKDNWLSYLPQVYQTGADTFLERYLFIFQSIHQDMENNINGIAGYFNPEVTDEEFLKWLAEWISLEDGYIWNEEQLRYLVKNSISIYKKHGTKEAISQMVELYLGAKPYVLEYDQVEKDKNDMRTAELVEKLYGDSPYQFTVVVSEDHVPTPREFKTLLRIVENAKPAHMEANIVVLKPYLFLDKYSYLGMNSNLGRYRPVSLDGLSALAFTSVSEAE